MKRNNNNHNIHASSVNDMPDIEIVDLENDTMQDTDSGNFHSGNTRSGSVHNFHTDSDDDIEDLYVDADEEIPEGEESVAPAGIRRFLNFHVLFALVLLIVVGVVGYRVTHWGQRISQSDIFKDGQGSYDDSWDSILPLTDENGQMIINDASNIVVFGNAPFADDRDSSDNLANLIAKETDTTVYNCSISGSYLAAQQLNYDPTVAPMDAYCLYWLVNLAVGVPLDGYYTDAANALGDKTPAEAEEVINTLKTLDFNTIDTVAIMYDATDYLSGNAMYSDENPTDPTQFTGNLEASIEVLQNYYPQIRIIVMSPTYAYAVDENGEVVDGDRILYVCGKYMMEQGALKDNTIVTTVMSNLGLYKACDQVGLRYEKTAVGDKYVFESMMEHGYSIGGEQSGHIIFSKYASTGDGILTSLKMMEVMMARKQKMSQLCEGLSIYPQVLQNVRVADKAEALANPEVQAAVDQVTAELGDTGRILVRESGTEPVIRVMVEAESEEICQKYVDMVVAKLK